MPPTPDITLKIDLRLYTRSRVRHVLGKAVFSLAVDLLLLFARVTGAKVQRVV